MPRSVEEWIGKTDDAAIPPRVKLRVWDRFSGRCQCGCNRKIMVGERWQADHIVALINGGEHKERNLQPLLTEHHKNKTKEDVTLKSDTYRTRLKQVGIKRASSRPLPFGRGSKLKRKLSGEVVLR